MSAHLEKIAIVGAGIGGLTAALALVRRGLNVEVYEQAHELRELGQVSRSAPTAPGYFTELGLKEALLRFRCSRPAKWSGCGTPGKLWQAVRCRHGVGQAWFALHHHSSRRPAWHSRPGSSTGKTGRCSSRASARAAFAKWRGRRARIRRGADHGWSRRRRRWCALSRAREFVRRRSTAILRHCRLARHRAGGERANIE